MAQTAARERLRFVDAEQLRGWVTSLEGVGIMSVKDEMLGGLDGLLVGDDDRPRYLVIVTKDEPKRRYLLPVGIAWFDETTGVIRTDADARSLAGCPAFDAKSYEQMSADQAWQYERRVLGACCPETLAQPGGRLDYYKRLPQFQPGEWLKK
jgi:hypothetical protein